MQSQAVYLRVIQAHYPQLAIRRCVLNTEGQFNAVLVVNDGLIFRFPRYPQGVETIQREVRLLRRLRGCLPIPIPDPIYTSGEAQAVGQVFMGYRMLNGEPLWRERFASIADDGIYEGLARQLANFLDRLHTLPLGDADACLPLNESLEEWRQFYADIRACLFPLMNAEGRRRAEQHFESFLARPELKSFRPALRHGDFGTGNLLYDAASRSISGVIDWGFGGLGDPATDIAAVSCFGRPFFEQFCRYYPGIDALLERARFYKGTFALQEALHGYNSGDSEALESGMAGFQADESFKLAGG